MTGGTAGRRRRPIAVAVALAAALLAAPALPVAAHVPTGQGIARWVTDKTSTYTFDSTVPAWLQTVMTNVLGVTWADSATNNTNGVRFTNGTSGDGIVYYTPTAAVCSGTNWLGCADARYTPWKIWIQSDPLHVGYFKNWCYYQLQTGCPDAGRVAIAEVGHIGGFLQDNQTVLADSRMLDLSRTSYPYAYTSTWNTRTMGRCDEASLQQMYDVKTFAGPYGDCFDHVTNAGPGGLKTTLTSGPASTTACSGDTVTISGRLQVLAGQYGVLGSNPLAGRVITIHRNGLEWSTATATTASGSNWSKAITANVSVQTTYNYTAQFDRAQNNSSTLTSGLASSGTTAFAITWLPSPPC